MSWLVASAITFIGIPGSVGGSPYVTILVTGAMLLSSMAVTVMVNESPTSASSATCTKKVASPVLALNVNLPSSVPNTFEVVGRTDTRASKLLSSVSTFGPTFVGTLPFASVAFTLKVPTPDAVGIISGPSTLICETSPAMVMVTVIFWPSPDTSMS